MFELDNVELEFTDDALEAVAEQALLRGTGARGLRAILEEVLLEVMYDLPSRTDIGKCVIDRSVVLDKVNPTLVPRAAPETETKTRPRRAAHGGGPARVEQAAETARAGVRLVDQARPNEKAAADTASGPGSEAGRGGDPGPSRPSRVQRRPAWPSAPRSSSKVA